MTVSSAAHAVSIASLALLAIATPAAADRLSVVGFLGLGSGPGSESGGFETGLRQLGQVPDAARLEYRWAAGNNARFAALAADLLKTNPRVVVAPCGPALKAVRDLNRIVPVVTICADPVHLHGEVASLARPAGHTTGLLWLAPETSGKRLELLKLIVPHVRRIGVLQHSGEPWTTYWAEMNAAARRANVTVEPYGVAAAEDLEPAFTRMARDGIHAVLVLPDAVTFANRTRIAELTRTTRLPSIFDLRPFVVAGGLMSYGPDIAELYRARLPAYVDRILKGAKPGDLPVEQPTRFVLTINRRAAHAMGVTVPPSLLQRADEVLD